MIKRAAAFSLAVLFLAAMPWEAQALVGHRLSRLVSDQVLL
jgi:hypothetical protein